MKTVGNRVGKLYDKLSDPIFHGPKAERLMREYVGLTRHPDKPDMAYFVYQGRTPGGSNFVRKLGGLAIAGAGVLGFLMWVRLIGLAIENEKQSRKEVQEIRQRVMEMIVEMKEKYPDFELPEDLFDEFE